MGIRDYSRLEWLTVTGQVSEEVVCGTEGKPAKFIKNIYRTRQKSLTKCVRSRPSVLSSVKVSVLKEGGMHNDHIATTNNQKSLLQILVEKN